MHTYQDLYMMITGKNSEKNTDLLDFNDIPSTGVSSDSGVSSDINKLFESNANNFLHMIQIMKISIYFRGSIIFPFI